MLVSYIGGKNFKTWVYEELLPELEAEEKGRAILPDILMGTIVSEVAKLYHTREDRLTSIIKGLQKGDDARKIAMYLSQKLAGQKLKNIEQGKGQSLICWLPIRGLGFVLPYFSLDKRDWLTTNNQVGILYFEYDWVTSQ